MRLVLFDVDGTLLDSAALIHACMCDGAVGDQHGRGATQACVNGLQVCIQHDTVVRNAHLIGVHSRAVQPDQERYGQGGQGRKQFAHDVVFSSGKPCRDGERSE